ncbi:hypothetical protein [uncultured Methylobacterium sp.]|jgi:hypothetical protein|uniref:hypothetical protein n=1 Tax=uncultured Methylobacterium sp. TaxID=157278 RepID=UPI0026183541|nr:hypothetical protein [uncultured Methylobacterium sp.]
MRIRFPLLVLAVATLAPSLASAMSLEDPRRAWVARDYRARCAYGDERACWRYERMKRDAAREVAKRRYYQGY